MTGYEPFPIISGVEHATLTQIDAAVADLLHAGAITDDAVLRMMHANSILAFAHHYNSAPCNMECRTGHRVDGIPLGGSSRARERFGKGAPGRGSDAR